MRFGSTALALALTAAMAMPAGAQTIEEFAAASVIQSAMEECAIAVDALDRKKFEAAMLIMESTLKESPVVIAVAKAKALELAKKEGSFCDKAKVHVPEAMKEMSAALAGQSQKPQKASAPVQAPAKAQTAKAIGLNVIQGLVGNTLEGESDGKATFEHFLANGTIKSLEGGQIQTGKWSVEGQKLCYKYPKEDKFCVTVEQVGDQVTMYEKDGTGWRYQLRDGNTKGL